MSAGTKASAGMAGLLVILLATPSNTAALEFAAASVYPVGTTPVAIAAADFNGDGKPDLAITNSGSNNVSILINNGDGTFKSAVNYAAGTSPVAIASGDFNGDGKQDLIVANLGNTATHVSGSLSLLKGNGDGTFQTAISIAAGSNPNTVAAADFNGDKKIDLAVGDASVSSVNVLLGNGDGTFKAPVAESTSTGFPISIVARDFNGDTKLDMAVGVNGSAIQVFLGNGDGTFQSAVSIAVANGLLVVADSNGDQKADLVVRSHIPPPPTCRTFCFALDQINLLVSNGDGTFQAAKRIATFIGAGTGNIAAGDFNGDGKIDISFGRLSLALLYLGKGDGTFLSVPSLALGNGTHFVTVGDLNGDKEPDFAFTNQTDNTVSILLNTSPASGADLGVTLAADPEPALATQDLTYTISVTNTGPQDATNVVLTDSLPASMKFVSATPSQGTCTGTTVVTCNLGAMPSPSQASATIVVTPTQAGSITNTVTVAATQPDLVPANDTASVTSTVLLPADLVLIKTASAGSVAKGSNITYTLVVNNKGPASATNVVLNDMPSASFPIVSTTTTQGSCTSDPNTGNVTCNLGSLAVAASATVKIVVAAASPTTLTNNAEVTADQRDLGHTFATATVLIDPVELALTETASPATLDTRSNVTFAITVLNKGPSTATNVQVFDSLPQNDVVSATASQGSCGAVANFQMGCSLGALASGASATVNVVMTPAAPGPFTNSVSVSSDSPDTDTSNNSASASVTVNAAADFAVSVAATTLQARPGSSVTDQLTFAAQNGFSGAIALTCNVSGPAPVPDCSLSPNAIPGGTNSATSTLTVSVPAGSVFLLSPRADWRPQPVYAFTLAFLLLTLALAISRSRRERKAWLLGGSLAAIVLALSGCGGGSSDRPVRSYSVTVTATSSSASGSISHSTAITLRVQ